MNRWIVLLLLALCLGCVAEPRTPPTPPLDVTPEALPSGIVADQEAQPASSMPDTKGVPPFELEEMEAGWHEALKYKVDDEVTVFWTTWKNTRGMWIGSVLIYHMPSLSMVVLDRNGAVDERYTRYESPEGQQRLEAVLAETELMERIRHYMGILAQLEIDTPSIEAFEAELETLRFDSAVPG